MLLHAAAVPPGTPGRRVQGLSGIFLRKDCRYAPPLGGKERFSFQAPEFTEELQQLDRDLDAVCFAEFSEEEIRQYRDMEKRISSGILHRLQAETASGS